MLTLVRRLLVGLALGAMVATAGCASMQPPAASPAVTTLEKIKATKTIALGYRDSSVPFSYAGPAEEGIGCSGARCTRDVQGLRGGVKLRRLQSRWGPVRLDTRGRALRDGPSDIGCGVTPNPPPGQTPLGCSPTMFPARASRL